MTGKTSKEVIWNNASAEWYTEFFGEHFSTVLAIELAKIKSSNIVLDIGCGSGNSCRTAAEFATMGRVIGIDPTPAMIRIAREITSECYAQNRIEFFNGSAEEIPLLDESVNIAITINSIHYWKSLHKGFSEVRRVLKPEGKFFIADELKNDNTTHGEGKLADPNNIISLINASGFMNTSYSQHRVDNEGMIFFSSEKD